MSSLKTRLSRLQSVGPTFGRNVPLEAKQEEPSQAPLAPSEPVLSLSKEDLLQQLREQISRVVARHALETEPKFAANPAEFGLPFVVEETACGPRYVRYLVYQPHHRVGRFGVSEALRAQSAMLALLSLDPNLAALDPGRALYLDTETTGLSGGTGTLAFLIGLGYFDETGRFVVEQLFLRAPGEEAPMLERVVERIQASSMLVSFNGKSFDMPLVRTRFVMNRIAAPVEPAHLDLLHVARRVHRGRIGACRLGNIENHVLGFERVDDVPSCEVASRYSHFLRTGDDSALQGVIDHNAWDVVSMAALVGIYGEPVQSLSAEDLAGVAKTLHRAKDMTRAWEFAELAVERGGGASARKARALVAKARGDRNRALLDLEAIVQEIDDPTSRLELAKIYEHHLRAPHAALRLVEQGTSESDSAGARRKLRLQRKIAASSERDSLKSKHEESAKDLQQSLGLDPPKP